MRFLNSLLSLAALSSINLLEGPSLSNFMMPHRDNAFRSGRPTHVRNRPGKDHPHSSKRQRARYARQINAGRCNLEPVTHG